MNKNEEKKVFDYFHKKSLDILNETLENIPDEFKKFLHPEDFFLILKTEITLHAIYFLFEKWTKRKDNVSEKANKFLNNLRSTHTQEIRLLTILSEALDEEFGTLKNQYEKLKKETPEKSDEFDESFSLIKKFLVNREK